MSFVERSASAIAVSVGLAVPVVGKLPQPTITNENLDQYVQPTSCGKSRH